MNWIPIAEEKTVPLRGAARRAGRARRSSAGAMPPTPPGSALLMAGDPDAAEWFRRAAARWRESWDAGDARSRGAARSGRSRRRCSPATTTRPSRSSRRWALELGTATAESPIGRYAAALALLALGRWPEARHVAESLREPRRLPARRRRCARVHRRARRRRLHRGGRVGRRRRSRRARSTSRTLPSPTRRSSCRSSPAAAASSSRSPPRRCSARNSRRASCRSRPARSRVERDRDRVRRLRLVLELGQLVDELVQERRARSRCRASRAPARCGTRRLAAKRSKPRCSSRSCAACSSLASPAARISGPTLKCFATGR